MRAVTPALEALALLDGLISSATGLALAELAMAVDHTTAIVEIGSYRGKSTCYLAIGARLGRGAHVWAIDAWDLEGNPPGWLRYTNPLNRTEFDAQVCDAGVRDVVTAIRGFSTEVAGRWGGPPVGLLFVDGSHVYEDVRADFAVWSTHLAPGAVVAFDDYGTPRNPGVRRAVDELGVQLRIAPRFPVPTLAVLGLAP